MTAGPANGEVKISVLLTRLAYLGCTPKQESLGVCVCVYVCVCVCVRCLASLAKRARTSLVRDSDAPGVFCRLSIGSDLSLSLPHSHSPFLSYCLCFFFVAGAPPGLESGRSKPPGIHFAPSQSEPMEVVEDLC